jgi:hypothetical protein
MLRKYNLARARLKRAGRPSGVGRRSAGPAGAALSVLAALPVGGISARAETAAPIAAWVELVDGGAAEARVVVAGTRCPPLIADGRSYEMQVRQGPDAAFPQTLCQRSAPPGSRRLSVGGVALPAPVPAPSRIVVLGDTGCRVKGSTTQACDDPAAWPFAEVARRAALEHPDLVIHVGDYYYRESPCPLAADRCQGPHGDAWPAWAADFFDPAAPLLKAAPWVFARGNHESCGRGAEGWFRLLDAAASPKTCPAEAAPFSVPISGAGLRILDSADAQDRSAPAEETAQFKRAIRSAPLAGPDPVWIVTHRPIWGTAPVVRIGPLPPVSLTLNLTEQAAVRGESLDGVELILSGHVHHFASFSFGAPRPAQLIVGTGGDLAEAADRSTVYGGALELDGLMADFLTFQRFGYVVLERQGGAWRGRFMDLNGAVVAVCGLRARVLSCRAASSS